MVRNKTLHVYYPIITDQLTLLGHLNMDETTICNKMI